MDRVAPKIPLCSWRSCCFSLYSPQQQTQAVSLYDPWADEPHASTEVKASSCTVNKITRRCCSVYSEIISTTSIDNLKINFLIKYWASPRLFWNTFKLLIFQHQFPFFKLASHFQMLLFEDIPKSIDSPYWLDQENCLVEFRPVTINEVTNLLKTLTPYRTNLLVPMA